MTEQIHDDADDLVTDMVPPLVLDLPGGSARHGPAWMTLLQP